MKHSTHYKTKRDGFVTILSVVVIGGFLLGLMAIMYRASIRSLEAQTKVQLQIDYELREQSLLRAIVTLAPKYAANTMMDNSQGANTATFNGLFTEAGNIAKVGEVLSSADRTALGFATHRKGNVGDVSTGFNISDYVGDGSGSTPSGVGVTDVDGYPTPLLARASSATTNSTVAPLISSDVTYNAASSSGDDRDFAMVPYPNIHFGYKNPGELIIARHNWWKIYLHPRSADITAAGIGAVDLDALKNEYTLSIYEIPSQLAISSSAFTELGSIGDESFDESEVTIEGGVFARKATMSHGTYDRVATTEGATISGATIGDGSAQGMSHAAWEAANNSYRPISKASDFSRSLFIPINPGFQFFDRFASSGSNITSGLSKDSWNQYSRGCHQCKMQLDVIEADGSDSPLALRFSYDGYSKVIAKAAATTTGDIVWPESDDDVFPFILETAPNSSPGLTIYLDRLVAWLQTADGGSLTLAGVAQNHSIVVNADYAQPSVDEPTSGFSPLVVILRGCEDLADFTEGFSLVTNYTLNILENLNQTPYVFEGDVYPPLSIFAPTIHFGINDQFRSVTVEGSVGSLNTGTDAVEILAFKDTSGNASAAQTKATLTPIDSLDELPPVNMMNWLVIIQKKQ